MVNFKFDFSCDSLRQNIKLHKVLSNDYVNAIQKRMYYRLTKLQNVRALPTRNCLFCTTTTLKSFKI